MKHKLRADYEYRYIPCENRGVLRVVVRPGSCGNVWWPTHDAPAECFEGARGAAPQKDVERTLRLLAQAVVTISDRDMIAVGDEVRRLAASTAAECFEPEPKPEPPRKYEDGQWTQDDCDPSCIGIVEEYQSRSRCYRLRMIQGLFHPPGMEKYGTEVWLAEFRLKSCAPVVTDAMKLLCWPGNRVRVVEHPASSLGKPYDVDDVTPDARYVGQAGTVQKRNVGRGEIGIDVQLNGGVLAHNLWPWNLEPAGSEQ